MSVILVLFILLEKLIHEANLLWLHVYKKNQYNKNNVHYICKWVDIFTLEEGHVDLHFWTNLVNTRREQKGNAKVRYEMVQSDEANKTT